MFPIAQQGERQSRGGVGGGMGGPGPCRGRGPWDRGSHGCQGGAGRAGGLWADAPASGVLWANSMGSRNGAGSEVDSVGSRDGAGSGTDSVGSQGGAECVGSRTGADCVGSRNGADCVGSRNGADCVGSRNGAGSGADPVGSRNGAGSGADPVGSRNGAGSGADAVGSRNGAGSGADSVGSRNSLPTESFYPLSSRARTSICSCEGYGLIRWSCLGSLLQPRDPFPCDRPRWTEWFGTPSLNYGCYIFGLSMGAFGPSRECAKYNFSG